jgi:chemotaxis protein MotB
VLISIPSERLFEGQGIGLTVGAEQPLQKLAGTLAQIRNGIRVISKADATPVLNSSYRSRWELSMARARVVAGILTDFGYTKSIDVLGRVDSLVAGSLSQSLAQGSTIDIVIAADEKQDSLYDVL